jgi:uncharacterized protein YcnI
MLTMTRARRALVAIVAASGLALVPALTAYAHVTVSSTDASPGGFGKVVFRVPNESDAANTTAVSVQLPTDTPFPFVSVGAVPGWTAATTTSPLAEPVEVEGFTVTEAVSTVTWTADGDGLPPEQFIEFALSVGPFPDGVDQFVFPATQTYSDGTVVNWSDPSVEGEEEPEHPAPVLSLTATDEEAADDSDSSADTLARVLGIVGIVLGAVAVAFALGGRRAANAKANMHS